MSDLALRGPAASLRLSTTLQPGALVLDAVEGEEHLSAPFRYALTVLATGNDVELAPLVGSAASIGLLGAEGDQRQIHGEVARTSQDGRHGVIELRPKLWQLTLATDCRIFQNQSVPEIVKQVLQEHGVDPVEDLLTGSYAPLEYCVQYQESSFDFVSRLLESAGICYYFKHSTAAHTLVLADGPSGHPPCTSSAIGFGPLAHGQAWLAGRWITAATVEQELTSVGVQLDDYAFVTPTADLRAERGDPLRRRYEYPGGYARQSEGEAMARLRLAEVKAEAMRLRGQGTVRAFSAGQCFTLSGHPRAALNGGWLLRSVWLRATRDSFDNGFVALPEATPFRPPRRTAKPRIAGAQTAVVVGAAGEELWTDQHGRIKVQFHWDQRGRGDQDSSCWVRVAQAWAGPGFGAFVLPRLGQEVVVSFLEGDPDRPLVTGCVYNGINAPPYALPDAQTRTTLKTSSSPGGAGFNELRFEDKAGEEEVYLKAQKDLTVAVGNARKVTVAEADDTLEVTKGNRSATVTAGNETLTVGGTRTVKVTGSETHTSEADHTHKVGGNLTIEVGGDITIKAGGALSLEAGTTVTIKAGTALELSGGTTMALKGATSGAVEAGAVLEVKGALVKINS